MTAHRPPDVESELAFHLEMLTRRYVAEGLEPAAARARALARIGDVPDVRRTCRRITDRSESHMSSRHWINGMGHDARHSLRLWRRAPLFGLAVVLTMAIGIGATTAIFSVVHAVLLRSLPYRTRAGW